MKLRFRRYNLIEMNSEQETYVVPVVGDAAVATVGVGHGRFVPLIIIDTTKRTDLIEVINVQAHMPPGDVKIQWGFLPKRKKHISLLLRFERPTERTAIIEFSIEKQGILLELILQCNAVYIQAGKVGDRLKHDLHRPKMLVEIPDTGIRKEWGGLHFKCIVKKLRKDGFNRSDAQKIATSTIKQMQQLGKLRPLTEPHQDSDKNF